MRSTLEQKAIFRHQVDTIQQFLFNTRPTLVGQIAQLVEQRIENPRVGGSIPSLATTKFNAFSLDISQIYFYLATYRLQNES